MGRSRNRKPSRSRRRSSPHRVRRGSPLRKRSPRSSRRRTQRSPRSPRRTNFRGVDSFESIFENVFRGTFNEKDKVAQSLNLLYSDPLSEFKEPEPKRMNASMNHIEHHKVRLVVDDGVFQVAHILFCFADGDDKKTALIRCDRLSQLYIVTLKRASPAVTNGVFWRKVEPGTIRNFDVLKGEVNFEVHETYIIDGKRLVLTEAQRVRAREMSRVRIGNDVYIRDTHVVTCETLDEVKTTLNNEIVTQILENIREIPSAVLETRHSISPRMLSYEMLNIRQLIDKLKKPDVTQTQIDINSSLPRGRKNYVCENVFDYSTYSLYRINDGTRFLNRHLLRHRSPKGDVTVYESRTHTSDFFTGIFSLLEEFCQDKGLNANTHEAAMALFLPIVGKKHDRFSRPLRPIKIPNLPATIPHATFTRSHLKNHIKELHRSRYKIVPRSSAQEYITNHDLWYGNEKMGVAVQSDGHMKTTHNGITITFEGNTATVKGAQSLKHSSANGTYSSMHTGNTYIQNIDEDNMDTSHLELREKPNKHLRFYRIKDTEYASVFDSPVTPITSVNKLINSYTQNDLILVYEFENSEENGLETNAIPVEVWIITDPDPDKNTM